jgi:high-affinity Fe2+/Pb2+ permease
MDKFFWKSKWILLIVAAGLLYYGWHVHWQRVQAQEEYDAHERMAGYDRCVENLPGDAIEARKNCRDFWFTQSLSSKGEGK